MKLPDRCVPVLDQSCVVACFWEKIGLKFARWVGHELLAHVHVGRFCNLLGALHVLNEIPQRVLHDQVAFAALCVPFPKSLTLEPLTFFLEHILLSGHDPVYHPGYFVLKLTVLPHMGGHIQVSFRRIEAEIYTGSQLAVGVFVRAFLGKQHGLLGRSAEFGGHSDARICQDHKIVVLNSAFSPYVFL